MDLVLMLGRHMRRVWFLNSETVLPNWMFLPPARILLRSLKVRKGIEAKEGTPWGTLGYAGGTHVLRAKGMRDFTPRKTIDGIDVLRKVSVWYRALVLTGCSGI